MQDDPLKGDRGEGASLRHALAFRAAADRNAALMRLQEHLKEHPSDDLVASLIVQAYGWSGHDQEAARALNTMLAPAGRDVLAGLEACLPGAMGMQGASVSTRYICFPNSMVQNLGFWSHTVTDRTGSARRVITKIMHEDHLGAEVTFYERIYPSHKGAAWLAPAPLAIERPEGTPIVLLTLEHIEGAVADPGSMGSTEISALVNAYSSLGSVPIRSVAEVLPPPVTENGLSHGYLAKAMHAFHTPEGTRTTLAWVRSVVSSRGYRPEVITAVGDAIEHWTSRNMHACIDPSFHYAFLHGDMHRHNVLLTGDRMVLIDWSRCTTGPKGLDLAVLLRRIGHQRVMDLAIRHGVIDGKDMISAALLSWALIIVSLELDLPPIKTEPLNHVFLPAADLICST
ncbi:MAG: phosphotransferase [Flavobacteriales bacterium]|nr:phosphotransferase [Flavobacteriales bacterium]